MPKAYGDTQGRYPQSAPERDQNLNEDDFDRRL